MAAKPGRPELSELEEALRRALLAASREQVLHMVGRVVPYQTEATAKPGLHGKVEKVSVSMPSELTEAIRSRTGAGGFSRYVAEAVQQRLRHDLLGDLLAELEAEHGPIPTETREETRRMWPDESP
jgi:Arc/MetJ-type ribon-helix-helix transcriptional regulator